MLGTFSKRKPSARLSSTSLQNSSTKERRPSGRASVIGVGRSVSRLAQRTAIARIVARVSPIRSFREWLTGWTADDDAGIVSGETSHLPQSLPLQLRHIGFQNLSAVVARVQTQGLASNRIDLHTEANIRAGSLRADLQPTSTRKEPDHRHSAHFERSLQSRAQRRLGSRPLFNLPLPSCQVADWPPEESLKRRNCMA